MKSKSTRLLAEASVKEYIRSEKSYKRKGLQEKKIWFHISILKKRFHISIRKKHLTLRSYSHGWMSEGLPQDSEIFESNRFQDVQNQSLSNHKTLT